MSARLRVAVTAAILAPLLFVAIVVGAREAPTPDPSTKDRLAGDVGAGGPTKREGGNAVEAVQAVERAEATIQRRQARSEDAKGEPGPSKEALGNQGAIADRAERVARRFFGAFSRYELGQLDREITAEIKATSTRKFARDLLKAPPRTGGGLEPPKRAELGPLDLLITSSRGGKAVALELVGEVRRPSGKSLVAIEMRRVGGRWLVGGLGG